MTEESYRRGLRAGLIVTGIVTVLAVAAFAAGWWLNGGGVADPPQVAPPRELMGWAGLEEANRGYEAVKDQLPKFDLRDDPSNAKKTIKLNSISRQLYGSDPPYYPQEIGSCVAFGAKHVVQHLAAINEFTTGEPTPRDVFPCYHYATGRNAPYAGAGRIRGPDGSIGSWQALACQRDGVIPSDLPGLPKYSAAVDREWAVRMPAQKWLDEGRKRLVKTVAKVTDADQIRDAVCSGYPCTIASDWGGLMRCPVQHGKLVNRRQGVWQHQMAVIGYDGSNDTVSKFGEPMFLIQNSWGDAHGMPPDDSPRGSFWIRKRDMDYIARQDCWAYSDLDGFVKRDLTAKAVPAVGNIALAL